MTYQQFPFFSFRSPLLTYTEQFFEIDMNVLLFTQFSNPQMQETIYLASPNQA